MRQDPQPAQLGGEGQRAEGERSAAAELRRLRREIAHLKLENDILKKAAVILGTRPQPQARAMIELICQANRRQRARGVRRPGAAPQQLLPRRRAHSRPREDAMAALIEAVFKRHRRRYGYRRIGAELSDPGWSAPRPGSAASWPSGDCVPSSPRTMCPKPAMAGRTSPRPICLLASLLPEAPNRAWAGDITFIPTSTGWLYLAVVIDLCSRRIVGWSLADHLRSDLVVDALRQALGAAPPGRGTIFHSDRGSQYGSTAFRRLLAQAGMRQSMSARANPYDNAWTESFIGTLKARDASRRLL